MALAAAAAVCSEARADGLRADSWAERAVASIALVTAFAVFAAPGPGDPSVATSLLWWVAGGAAAVLATLGLTSYVGCLPSWLPAVAAVAGVMLALVA
jgi:hypothetical protein